MLEIVMTRPLDLGRLRNAGVSDAGIDFVSKMIVVDPAGRSTEAELLQHAWITKIGHEDSHDVQMIGGSGSLGYVEGDESELDASQLSLADNPSHREVDDSEEELATDIEEAEGGRQSKRFKLDESSDYLQASEDVSVDHVNYPLLPGMLTDSIDSEPAPVPTTQRLFGEIGASALRSSGVLGYDAHAALQMPFEGSPDESFDTSESWINDARIISDGGVLPAAQYPQLLRGPTFTGSAASLLGTEALVGQLNMTSLDSGASAPSSVSTFETPQTPKSRDASLVPAGPMPGSKGSSQIAQTIADQITPKRTQPNNSETRSPHHGVTSLLKHYRSPGSVTGGDLQHNEPELSQPAKPSSPSSATAAAGEKIWADGGEARSGIDRMGETELGVDKAGEASVQASENALPLQAVAGITSVSNLSQASGHVASQAPSPPSFPKPPPRFGTLIALPGSVFNTTIRLERRITYYGRDPSSHVQHMDMKEPRIPKNALDIIFWRPGIEAMIASGKEWSSIEDLYAIVHTRTSQNIKVNGVKLTKGEGCWNYGRLHTGDVITIFGPPQEEQVEGKAAEYLKFRCEFFLGLSAKPREKGSPRFVVEKEEEKFMQNQMRRSMSSTSQGSG
jgi:serine/threonine protein kinase